MIILIVISLALNLIFGGILLFRSNTYNWETIWSSKAIWNIISRDWDTGLLSKYKKSFPIEIRYCKNTDKYKIWSSDSDYKNHHIYHEAVIKLQQLKNKTNGN